MPDPLTTMMLAAGIGKTLAGGFKAWQGAKTRRNAKREREQLLEDQPQYETPSSIEDLSALYGDYLAQARRTEGFPGQEQMEQRLQEQTSSRVRDVTQRARNSTQALGATTDLLSREMDALEQLEIQGAKYAAERELQGTQMYGQALGQQAQYEDQAWRYNEWMPWRTRLAEQQARYRGGQRTLESGWSDIFSGLTQTGMTGMQAGWFEGSGESQSNNEG